MIVNKSNHPVEIKRIALTIWSLRTEIEKAVEKRLEETEEGNDPNLEDIKQFYNREPRFMTQDTDFDEDDDDDDSISAEEAAAAENMDSSGNPMDDDAAAMAAALAGGDEDEASEESEESEDSDESTDEESVEAKGGEESEGEEGEDSEVASEVEDIAAAMLADQGINPKIETNIGFTRPKVDKDETAAGFTILSDINMFYALFFSEKPYLYGQTICIKLNIPNGFTITAEVISVTNLTRNSRVISTEHPQYRIQTRLSYMFDGERAKLREFLESIEPEIPPPPKKMKRMVEDKEDDDDDFEDLGF
jgi:hypothetical protein